jgi:hypothetical protein
MGLQQKGGAAHTFAIRYLTVALLNIVVKGEDTDGHHRERGERGPVTPPPSEKSMGNAWAKSVEAKLKRDPHWWGTLASGFAEAPTSEDLEALVDLVRDNVNALDAGKQKDIAVALMKARARLSATPKGFDFPVKDAQGDTDGELFSDIPTWIREFKEYWNSADGADDRENLLHHNADALAAAQSSRSPLLKDVNEWRREASTENKEPVTPLLFGAVQPPMNNGKSSWSGWFRAMRQELFTVNTHEDLAAFIEAQRTVMADAGILWRQMAINEMAKACGERVTKPDWLRGMILPITAACDHKEWAEARMAELHWITDKEAFTTAVNAAIPRMKVIQKEDKETYDRVKAVFTEKQAKLP